MINFKFNDFISKENGIIIKKMSDVISPLKNIKSIEVEGSNNTLYIDKGNYLNYDMNIECILKDLSKLDNIKKNLKGIGKLIRSDMPDRYFNVRISNQIAFEKYLTYLKEFEIQFEVQPISYSILEKELLVNTNKKEFIINGTVETEPILAINGNGKIRLNNTEILISNSNGELILDCKLLNATILNNNANDKVYFKNRPVLLPGNNIIELTGITSVKIKYREGWL